MLSGYEATENSVNVNSESGIQVFMFGLLDVVMDKIRYWAGRKQWMIVPVPYLITKAIWREFVFLHKVTQRKE